MRYVRSIQREKPRRVLCITPLRLSWMKLLQRTTGYAKMHEGLRRKDNMNLPTIGKLVAGLQGIVPPEQEAVVFATAASELSIRKADQARAFTSLGEALAFQFRCRMPGGFLNFSTWTYTVPSQTVNPAQFLRPPLVFIRKCRVYAVAGLGLLPSAIKRRRSPYDPFDSWEAHKRHALHETCTLLP